MIIQQLVNDIHRGHAVGFGVKVGDDAVAEDGFGRGADVVDVGGHSAVQDAAGFGSDNQVLGGTGSSAPADPVADELGRGVVVRPRFSDEVDSVVDDEVGHGHAADEFLEVHDFFGVHDGFGLGL